MEQAQEQSEAQSQSFCRKDDKSLNASVVQPASTRLRAHLLLPQFPHPTDECQVEADSETVLEEKRRSAAVQLPFGDDGDAVAQKVSFIHVMSGENHCSTCTRVQQTLRRLQTYFTSPLHGRLVNVHPGMSVFCSLTSSVFQQQVPNGPPGIWVHS